MQTVRVLFLSAVLLGLCVAVIQAPSVLSADPSEPTITLKDLPPGFTAVPPEMVGDFFGPVDPEEEFAPQGEFVFLDFAKGYVLGGATIQPLAPDEILMLDLLLDNPQTLRDMLDAQADFPLEVTNVDVLDSRLVGDLSAAFSAQLPSHVIDMSELAPHAYDGPAQMDLYVFRRDSVLPITFVIYPPADPPGFDLEEIAVIWNDRLSEQPSQKVKSPSPGLKSTPEQDPLYTLLTLQDLPDGFEDMSQSDSEQLLGDIQESMELPLAGVFAFVDEANLEGVIGATFALETEEDQLVFDFLMDKPQTLLAYISQQGDEPSELPPIESLDLSPIGEFSSAISFVIPAEASTDQSSDMPMQVDIAFFRRDGVGAALAVLYPAKDAPSISLEDLAALWDEQIHASLDAQTQPAKASARSGPVATRTPVPTPSPTSTPAATPTPLAQAVVVVSALNLRDGPGINYSSLGTVERGDELEVIGQHDTCAWVQVVTPSGEEGWVSGAAQYVALESDCSTVSQGIFRPATGQLGRFIGNLGSGELLVENGSNRDGVVVMTTADDRPVLSAYVRKDESYKLSGIPDDTYLLYVLQGDDWNDQTKTFTTSVSRGRFDDPFPFASTSETYQSWTVTLHPVEGGTATTSSIPADEFPQIE